jgi:hypothetical protein
MTSENYSQNDIFFLFFWLLKFITFSQYKMPSGNIFILPQRSEPVVIRMNCGCEHERKFNHDFLNYIIEGINSHFGLLSNRLIVENQTAIDYELKVKEFMASGENKPFDRLFISEEMYLILGVFFSRLHHLVSFQCKIKPPHEYLLYSMLNEQWTPYSHDVGRRLTFEEVEHFRYLSTHFVGDDCLDTCSKTSRRKQLTKNEVNFNLKVSRVLANDMDLFLEKFMFYICSAAIINEDYVSREIPFDLFLNKTMDCIIEHHGVACRSDHDILMEICLYVRRLVGNDCANDFKNRTCGSRLSPETYAFDECARKRKRQRDAIISNKKLLSSVKSLTLQEPHITQFDDLVCDSFQTQIDNDEEFKRFLDVSMTPVEIENDMDLVWNLDVEYFSDFV